jgi:SAM-dependent methyltransferase
VTPVYREFAAIYAAGDYSEFSRRMAECLPAALRTLDIQPSEILDLACGEGTFACEAAKLGYRVTGLDRSEEMLGFARKRALDQEAHFDLVRGDMRALPFTRGFDLVTCWFDSLNYVVDLRQLTRVFCAVAEALRAGGLFVFDMNTTYGLAVNWRENPCYVRSDDARIFEVHRQDYNFETGLAEMRITAFVKQGDSWTRIEEVHRERAYTQKEIREALGKAGLQVLAAWGSFRDRSEATDESPRVWFVAKRAPAPGEAPEMA